MTAYLRNQREGVDIVLLSYSIPDLLTAVECEFRGAIDTNAYVNIEGLAHETADNALGIMNESVLMYALTNMSEIALLNIDINTVSDEYGDTCVISVAQRALYNVIHEHLMSVAVEIAEQDEDCS